jgi:DNA ligase (NAD+)
MTETGDQRRIRVLGSTEHLSTQKVDSVDEIVRFDAAVRKRMKITCQVSYTVDLKFDGMAVMLRYEDGRFAGGNSRGGTDLAASLDSIPAVPKTLLSGHERLGRLLVVRGRIYTDYRAIELVKRPPDPTNLSLSVTLDPVSVEAGTGLYDSPRSLAMASLQSGTPSEGALHALKLIVNEPAETDYEIPWTFSEFLDVCGKVGLPVSPHRTVCHSIEAVTSRVQYLLAESRTLPYPTAGVNVVVDALDWWPHLGTTKKFPKWLVTVRGLYADGFPAHAATS